MIINNINNNNNNNNNSSEPREHEQNKIVLYCPPLCRAKIIGWVTVILEVDIGWGVMCHRNWWMDLNFRGLIIAAKLWIDILILKVDLG